MAGFSDIGPCPCATVRHQGLLPARLKLPADCLPAGRCLGRPDAAAV